MNIFTDEKYNFLKTNEHLGDNIILLAYGGSHAYGTNIETSDVDVRGIALPTKREVLLGKPFEQVLDSETDTCIYSFTKIMKLLTDNNPNVLEILFSKDFLYLTYIGQELVDNRHMFLSKRVINTFGGYAKAQLRRLDNKSMRSLSQSQQEQHILNSIENASFTFPEKYFYYDEDNIKLYTDVAVQNDLETEIFMDINLRHYPLRDYKCMWSEMHNIVKDYAKLGKRNTTAIAAGKLNKHAMHLIRLLLMCIEILDTGTFCTYRDNDHDLLMAIRNGEFMESDGQMLPRFFEMVDELEEKMKVSAEKSLLPEKPDYKKIDDFTVSVLENL